MPHPSSDAAEAAFYAAFEARDLDAMTRVWADDPAIACVHPLTVPLTGAAVAVGWRSIFEAAGRFRIRFEVLARQDFGDTVVHIVKEHLTIGDESSPRPAILATNVYRRAADGWRMWLHHGSPVQVGDSDAAPVVLH